CGGERIANERAGPQLTVLVEDGFLDHRLANTLRQAAVNLSFHDQRVDQMTVIVDGDELQEVGLTSLAIDLEHGDVATERVGVVRRLEIGVRAQPWLLQPPPEAGWDAGRRRER